AGVLSVAEPAANLQARNARKHPVENDEIGRVLRQTEFGFFAPVDTLDEIAFRFEIVGEEQRGVRLVLDDEDASRRSRAEAAGGIVRGLIHVSCSAALRSMSVSRRPRGRSEGIASPVTR